jgi:diaminohydroxyphosphoribosylaminopyrimidine deaminase/5-amino-6-(5-phosphoribosylamino)uracil reductase
VSMPARLTAPRADRRERPTDQIFMRQALALAERHLGLTAPNPSVGAVLVDERQARSVILARAVTAPRGRPHAERIALDEAGDRARGATLFVTLEPCAHHGRTPPCAEAVIAAGVVRVVCGIEDPDARVAGRGLDLLRRAGIEVMTGVLEAQCRNLHAGHIMRVTAGRPFVTLKLAMTSDGFAARANGRSLGITGGIANAQTHLLRARSDAILVGVGTVLSDDPKLTCRLPGLEARSPIRVVLDTHLRTPKTAQIVVTALSTPTWIIAGTDASRDREARLRDAGVLILRTRVNELGRVDIHQALQVLGERGVTHLMCEGGPSVANELAKADVIDAFVQISSARELGGSGLAAIGNSLSDVIARRLVVPTRTLIFGEDRWVQYERSSACSLEL